jgi:spermidine/putrescine-binding protein
MKFLAPLLSLVPLTLLISAVAAIPAHAETPTLSLNIHAWAGYVEPYLADASSQLKAQGFNLSYERTLATGLPSFERELRQGTADLVSPANDLIPVLAAQGLLQPLPENCAPKQYSINPLIILKLPTNFSRYAVPFTFGPYALAYNTKSMSAPNSYRVLWDPRYRGRISISDYDTANIYMVALMLGYSADQLFNLSDDQLKNITNKLTLLRRQQQPIYWKENLNPLEASRLDVGTDWSVGVKQINQKSPGSWGIVIPREGATAWVDSWAIGAHVKGEKLKAACAFINIALSAKSQAEVARATGYGVVNMYVGRFLSAAEIVDFHITDPNYLNRLILWQPLSAENLKRYQKAWIDSAVDEPKIYPNAEKTKL